MSASREKKNRQDPTIQSIRDEKTAKQQAQAAKDRRSRNLYILVAVVFVVVGIAAFLGNSGIFQRNTAAMEINGVEYKPAQVSYYYRNAINSVANSSYSTYFGLDTKTAYDQQNINDTAKLLLGLSDESIVTWQDYFMYATKKTLINTQAVTQAAKEAGFTFTDEMNAEVQETLDTIKTYAKQNGMSTGSYLKAIYGKYMTVSLFQELLKSEELVQHYMTNYQAELTYTDDELEAFYAADKEHFDQADYEYLYISGATAAKTDADGKTIEATEEETAAAAQAARDCLADAEKRVAAGESMEEIANSYDNSTLISYRHVSNATTDGTDVAKWAYDAARQAGDTTTIDTTAEGGVPTYYVALFHSAGRPEYPTVNVRHILITPNGSNSDTEAAKAEAKEKAETLLQQWKDGEATEASFAALATESTADPGSAATGGLYENIRRGQMVQAFNDWCFDASRQAGDTGIVETSYGYHIMYFVSTGDTAWKVMAREEKAQEDVDAYVAALVDGLEAKELSGMKYVG